MSSRINRRQVLGMGLSSMAFPSLAMNQLPLATLQQLEPEITEDTLLEYIKLLHLPVIRRSNASSQLLTCMYFSFRTAQGLHDLLSNYKVLGGATDTISKEQPIKFTLSSSPEAGFTQLTEANTARINALLRIYHEHFIKDNPNKEPTDTAERVLNLFIKNENSLTALAASGQGAGPTIVVETLVALSDTLLALFKDMEGNYRLKPHALDETALLKPTSDFLHSLQGHEESLFASIDDAAVLSAPGLEEVEKVIKQFLRWPDYICVSLWSNLIVQLAFKRFPAEIQQRASFIRNGISPMFNPHTTATKVADKLAK